jgi:hypothetical protein
VKGTHEKVEILRTDSPGNWPILAVIRYDDGQVVSTMLIRLSPTGAR